jgi:hypothetical protein
MPQTAQSPLAKAAERRQDSAKISPRLRWTANLAVAKSTPDSWLRPLFPDQGAAPARPISAGTCLSPVPQTNRSLRQSQATGEGKRTGSCRRTVPADSGPALLIFCHRTPYLVSLTGCHMPSSNSMTGSRLTFCARVAVSAARGVLRTSALYPWTLGGPLR